VDQDDDFANSALILERRKKLENSEDLRTDLQAKLIDKFTGVQADSK